MRTPKREGGGEQYQSCDFFSREVNYSRGFGVILTRSHGLISFRSISLSTCVQIV